MALASTQTPVKPVAATARAVSSAACGGQTERTTSARRARSAVWPAASGPAAAVSPATAARAWVAGPRPAGTHSTWYPRPVRQAATAAPISPGCSSPISVSLTRPVSRGAGPGRGPGPALRPLPGRKDAQLAQAGLAGQRRVPVTVQHAELYGEDGSRLRRGRAESYAGPVGQHEQRAAVSVRPQHGLLLLWPPPDEPPAAEHRDHLPGPRGEFGEGEFRGQRVQGLGDRGDDDLAAVRREQRAERVGADHPAMAELAAGRATLPVQAQGQPAGRQAAARRRGIKQPDPVLAVDQPRKGQRPVVRRPRQRRAGATQALGDRLGTRPGPDALSPRGQRVHLDLRAGPGPAGPGGHRELAAIR